MNVCVRCGGSFRSGEPRVGGICSRCWAKKLSTDPQPRQPLKTAPSLDYTAGFRAGIEAAAVHVLRGVLPGTESLQAPDAGRIATAIRNLKPEPGHD